MFEFILKVVAISALLSIAIKYGAPLLAIPATTTVVLIAVFLPTVLMAIGLSWRWQQSLPPDE